MVTVLGYFTRGHYTFIYKIYKMRYVTQMKYLHIHNCRDHLLKFKPEQYTSQLKIMPLYIFTYTYIYMYIYIYLGPR